MAAVLALSGAVLWGVGDFLGGLASRRIAVLAVLAISQGIGLVGRRRLGPRRGRPVPRGRRAAAGGRRGGRGARRARRALPRARDRRDGHRRADQRRFAGRAAGSRRGTRDAPAPLQWLGVVFVLAGIVDALARAGGVGRPRIAAGAGLALVAALGFGVLLRRHRRGVGRERSLGGRRGALGLGLARPRRPSSSRRTSLRPPRSVFPLLVGVGVFDTGANVCVAFATTEGAAGSSPSSAPSIRWSRSCSPASCCGEAESAEAGGGVVALAGAALVAAADQATRGVRPGRLAVGARERLTQIAVGIAQPDLAVIRPAGAVGPDCGAVRARPRPRAPRRGEPRRRSRRPRTTARARCRTAVRTGPRCGRDGARPRRRVAAAQGCRRRAAGRTRRRPCVLSTPRSSEYQRLLAATSVTDMSGCGRHPYRERTRQDWCGAVRGRPLRAGPAPGPLTVRR